MLLASCGGSEAPAPPPTISAISPLSGVQGTTVTLTVAGTNFSASATTLSFAGAGLTVSAVQVTSATSATAQVAIAADAALGPHAVSLRTPSGAAAGSFVFTVLPPAPALVSLNPATIAVGATVVDSLVGTGFVGGATVAVDGVGVTVANTNVASGTLIVAVLVADPAVSPGARHVTVTTAGGTS
ncbi:MAG: IPT/TIG domain-containing protein, partial [Gemmatimonadota bacterium]|nr:IPT/TIG domain-containing protein [Gemmatimonadota bacterium]